MKTIKKIILTFIITSALLFLISCPEPVINKVKKTVYIYASTVAEFWGLPGIRFVNWRPNIHIKASSNNGSLVNRLWDGQAEIDPDTWSLFEYSQILYYDSNFIGMNIQPDKDATVDNEILMPLAFENKLYKRVSPDSTEEPKYDVTWNKTDKSVVITLNTINSNFLLLRPGARIAVFATQRPTQWGGNNDYSIIDAIPGTNSLQKSVNYETIKDNTSDRSSTRDLNYIEFKGGTLDIEADTKDFHNNLIWFKRMTITEDKIVLYMPYLENGNKAKEYWDAIDSKKIEPFMLFWIAIEQ